MVFFFFLILFYYRINQIVLMQSNFEDIIGFKALYCMHFLMRHFGYVFVFNIEVKVVRCIV